MSSRKFDPSKASGFTFLLLYFSSITFLGNAVERHEQSLVFIPYLVSFFCYGWLVQFSNLPVKLLFITGVLTRIGLFFSLPNLSDDFYRFLWDGTILRAGISPYGILPEEALELGLSGLNQPFLEQLNSPDYYTIYPPLNQALFWLSSLFGNFQNLLPAINSLRIFIVVADIIALYYLQRILQESPSAYPQQGFLVFLKPLGFIRIYRKSTF